jgi:RimJ/RimL family protein N-acetyltransferase
MEPRLAALDWPVHTERLTIRPATVADLEATWRYRRVAEVTRWMTGAPRNVEAYRVKFENPDRLAKTLLIELGGVVIGDLMLSIEDAWAQAEVADQAKGVQAELGWCLDPEYGGHGYASEAVRALIRVCFEDLGLRRVIANCFADNTASWRLMERLGMRRETHTIRESLHRSGEWMDGMSYALLAEEWREVAD